MNSRKAIFLDRDGVINKKRDDYVKNWNEFEFIEGSVSAIKTLSKMGYVIIIVTNQSAINRGIISEDVLFDIHENMQAELKKHGAWVDAILFCPHRPDENCTCRKPKTGMLEKAILEFNLSVENCLLVGDSESDIQAGNALGIKTFLLNDGKKLLDFINFMKEKN